MPLRIPDELDGMGETIPESHENKQICCKGCHAVEPDQASRVFVCFLAVPICVL